jgi:hypothetical protein
MNKTNVPQTAGNTETIIGGVIAVAIIALIAFCCCGRSSKYEDDYTPRYTPSSSSSTSSSSDSLNSVSNSNLNTTLKSDANNSPSFIKKAIVITKNANLRKSGNSNSEVIQTISEGTNVEVVKQDGAWFLVKNIGQSGWIHGNSIRLITSTTESSKPSSIYPSYEDDITRRRYAECVRQREAFGVDTSPCSEWASER